MRCAIAYAKNGSHNSRRGRDRRGIERYQLPLRLEKLEDRALLSITPVQGGTPNYYGPEPNWAYSPAPVVDPVSGAISGGIQKFIDALPGVTAAGANNLGQYISLAVPDTTTYPGSDYYEIALVQYTEKMSSSLNPTTLRGYVQIETPANTAVSKHYALTYPDGTPILNAASAQVYSVDPPEYLGPIIVSQKDVPTRIKFTNYLPKGEGGDLFLPVDTTVMGSGAGPIMAMPMMVEPVGGATPTLVNITTMVMPAPNNYSPKVGELVRLDGFTPIAYNGEYRVTAVTDATHFQIDLKKDPGGPATVLGTLAEAYTQNRATLHLHGGATPWISDGTPHQWTTPAGETTDYPDGVSVQNVPDMPDPGDGSETFFYSNQQSARLMFYHDHAYGITRLNVYAGEAAGYLLTDAVEQDLIARGIIPAAEVPLIIQDKTFIDPNTVLTTDPTWPFAVDPTLNNLWAPHVYMPNQNPNSLDGTNPFGRWDYGPFFWPPWPTTNKPLTNPTGVTITNGGSGYTSDPLVTITPAPGDTTGSGATATATVTDGVVTAITLLTPGTGYTANPIITVAPPSTPGGVTATVTVDTSLVPNLPDLSMTMEAFQDTPVVNGTLYPYYDVQPQAYRFRILNAADDRTWNLQLYVASTIVESINVTNGGSGYSITNPPCVTITPDPRDTTGMGATTFHPVIDPVTGTILSIAVNCVGSGYLYPPIVTIDPPPPGGTQATATATIYTGQTEVGMVPAVPCAADFPDAWTVQTIGSPGNILDNRTGGIPDPRNIGPSMVQIGTEGGFLPTPVVLENTPVGYERNPKNIVVMNVAEHTLLLGPAERADVIIDFSQFAGKTIILYNDAPAAVPAADSRLDYYTNDVAQTDTGGTVSTLPGYGPNTRTVMAFNVSASGVPQPFDMTNLMDAFATMPEDTTGSGATATATINPTAGTVTAVTPVNGGSNYSEAPVVTIAAPSPGGVRATATAHIVNGVVTSITVTNPGSGYATAPVVTITPAPAHDSVFVRDQDPIIVPQAPYDSAYGVNNFPDDTSAYSRIQDTSLTFTPTSVALNKGVASVAVANGGSGYTSAPTVSFSGGGGTGAAAVATITGIVSGITLDSGGSGYAANTTVAITGGGGTGATATATVMGGEIMGITITNPGTGYTLVPTVAFTGGGTGAGATATITNVVDSISMTATGSGYTAAPVVTLDGGGGTGAAAIAKFTVTIPFQPKAIQELFENTYGRMNATMGVELPFTNGNNQTTIPYGYIDPVTEIFDNTTNMTATPLGSAADGTQFWKITHNGVDTHAVHVHLFNVQVINRVGWDGQVKPPDANELGWKETFRANPLEDIIIAARPVAAALPFGVPESIRLLDPTMPQGSTTGFYPIGPDGNPVTVTNEPYNYGWEYVWHCHLLSHEEMDMMRPMQFNVATVAPGAPVLAEAVIDVNQVTLNWIDPTPIADPATWGDPTNEIGFRIEVAPLDAFDEPGTFTTVGTALANATGYVDYPLSPPTDFAYRVVAYNANVTTDGSVPSPLYNETVSNIVKVHGFVNTLAVAIAPAPTQLDPTNQSPVHFAVAFSVPVADFTSAGVTLEGTAGATTVIVTPDPTDARYYDAAVSGMTGSGTIIASIPDGAAHDSHGNPIPPSPTPATVNYDVTVPTVTVTPAAGQRDPTKTAPIHFAVAFSKPVLAFSGYGVTFAGSTAPGTLVATVTGSDATYDVAVSGMTGTGTVVVGILENAAHDIAGNSNTASATPATVTYDVTQPTATVTLAAGQLSPINVSPIRFTATFSKPVTGFSASGVVFTGSTAPGHLAATVTGSGTTYAISVSGMTGGGTVFVGIPAGVATDAVGNTNTAAVPAQAKFVVGPPTFALTGPTSGTFVAASNVTIRWNAGNVVATDRISLCYDKDTIWWNGNETWIEIDQVHAVDGASTYTWNTTGVVPGKYYMAGYLYRTSPYLSHLMTPITISNNHIGPAISSVVVIQTAPPYTPSFTTAQSLKMTFNATDPYGVTGAAVTLDGRVKAVNGPYAAPVGVNFSTTFGKLSAGVHNYSIVATDRIGNRTSPAYTGQFTVVVAANVLSTMISQIVVTPSKGSMTWNAYSPSGVASSTLTVDGKAARVSGPYAAASGVNYSGNYGALAAGNHSFVISVTDKLGAASQYVGTFAALTVAASTPPRGAAASLGNQQLASIVSEAKQRLAASGALITAAMAGVRMQIADLPGSLLSETIGKTIFVDRDAAGYGWFVDPTPADDLEFATVSGPHARTAANNAAAQRVDLLTTVMHEIGHVVGYEHSSLLDMMYATLPLGTRRSSAAQPAWSTVAAEANDVAGSAVNLSVLDQAFATI
jgi:FtsP/CotA-like multicopper oxidase with cupredoxin domain